MSEIEFKNIHQRDEYRNGIEKFLDDLKEKAEQKRKVEFTEPESKEHLRRKYIDMLGYPLTSYTADSNINIKTEPLSEDKTMTVTRYQLEVMPGFWFYGVLYEHKESSESEKNALVIAQHGGGGSSEIVGSLVMDSANYNHMVKRVLHRGVTVFAPQLLLWDQELYGSKGYDRIATDKTLRQYGGSITGLEIYCIQRSIDYFSGLNHIDEKRIGMIGLSYGGMYTLYTAAADVRIKVSLSSCWFNNRLKYNLADWVYFNQANLFFDAEVASLILPRKVYIEIGKSDELFDYREAEGEIRRLREYAEKEKCGNCLRISIFDGGHELDKAGDGIEFFIEGLGISSGR